MFCFSSSSRIAWSWSWSQQDGAESGQHHQGSLFSEQSISLTTLPFFLHRPPLQLRGLGSCTSCSLFCIFVHGLTVQKRLFGGNKTNKKKSWPPFENITRLRLPCGPAFAFFFWHQERVHVSSPLPFVFTFIPLLV